MKNSNRIVGAVVIVVAVVAIVSLVIWRNQPQAGQPAKVKLAIVTWVGYGPFFVAKEKGFFQKQGVDVDIVKIEEPGARHSALISGNVQFSISTLDLFANEAPQGLPAVCFLKLTDSYGADGIVAKKEITTIKDLQGKTVAFEKGSPSHFFLTYLMEREGLSIKDIVPKYMPAPDAGAAFAAGQVDAAVTWEPWVSKANQTAFGHILVTSREKSGLLLDVLLAQKDFASKNRKIVEGVLRAWFQAVEFCRQNPIEANPIMAKGLGLSNDEFGEMLKGDKFSDYAENRRYFGLGSSEPGPFLDVFQHAEQIWLREGIITKTVKPEDVFDTSYLRALSQ